MRRPDLLSDCGSCAALCCVAPSFDRSEDFAYDKPAGERCMNLTSGDQCSIHAERVERGYLGCTVYDCYGAGQRVIREFGREPSVARERAFYVLRDVHELLFLLTQAAALCPLADSALRAEIDALVGVLDALHDPPQLSLGKHRAAAHALLRRVGEALGGRPDARRLPVV
jgi:hypothetical protein